MVDETNTPEKKIIVDEDWKSQVEAERESARRTEHAATPGSEEAKTPAGEGVSMPPADLFFLIGRLYLEGAIALGLLPNPLSNKSEVRRDQAKHVIDLLAMLQEKTKGNCTPDEASELDAALHQLRLEYVSAIDTPPVE